MLTQKLVNVREKFIQSNTSAVVAAVLDAEDMPTTQAFSQCTSGAYSLRGLTLPSYTGSKAKHFIVFHLKSAVLRTPSGIAVSAQRS
jgi:hypothetical protein